MSHQLSQNARKMTHNGKFISMHHSLYNQFKHCLKTKYHLVPDTCITCKCSRSWTSTIHFITGCSRCLPGAVSWEGTGQEDPDSTKDNSSVALSSTLPEDEGQLYHNANNMEGVHCQKKIPYGTDTKTTTWLMNSVNSWLIFTLKNPPGRF